MFCLVTYILTQLISYEFILCCTCYDKLSTKKRNFKHLSEYERGEIYAMIKLGCSISSIARHLKRSRTTIYNELKGGRVEQIKNGHKVIVYYPDAGQRQYEKNRKNSKKKFKVLECIDFIKFVEKSYLKDQNI